LAGPIQSKPDTFKKYAGSSVRDFDYHELLSFERDDVEIIARESVAFTTKEFRHQNMVRKILFFLRREGIFKLLKKVKSRKSAESIDKKSVFLVVRHKGSGVYYAGMQFSETQPVFYFLPFSASATARSIDSYDADFKRFNPFWGFLLEKYETTGQVLKKDFQPVILKGNSAKGSRDIELHVVGCGDYARTAALSHFKDFTLKTAVDFNPEVLALPELANFETRTNDAEIAFKNEGAARRCALIASYHSYHSPQAVKFLKAGFERIIIEKPPCVTFKDLEELAKNFDQKRVLVGYNRRFIEWNHTAKALMRKYSESFAITILIQEVQITPQHWYFLPNQGTRVTGNLCHWVDLVIFLIDAKPVRISIAKNRKLGIDYSSFSLFFDDGSVVNFIPSDLGDGTQGVQEKLFIKSHSLDIAIDDYLTMKVWEKGETKKYSRTIRDKGHATMYKAFRECIVNNKPGEYSLKDLVYSTAIYISFVELFYSENDSMELDFSRFYHS
jgi:predicted dehydrogenase